jgi:CelD/BcsL family acetyltransferase involved in cellulose biosynthesis
MTFAAIQPLALAWAETQTQLRYSLSDYSLFSLRIPAHTCALPLEPLLPATFESDLDAFIRSAPEDVPLLCVRNLPIAERMPALRSANGRLQYTINQSYQYYVDLKGDFDDYVASLSGKSRATLRRKARKFASLHGDSIDWRVYTSIDQMPDYHRLARQVAVKTYQEKLFNGALPADERFKMDLCKLAEEQRIRGYLLFSNDTPIAYLHLPIRDNVVEYAYLGYDPAYASVSPGTVLLFLALEDLFSKQRFNYFDLSYGLGQTKEVFCTAKYLRADVFYFARSLKYYLAVCSHLVLDSTSTMLGRSLGRIRLRAGVKRLLRQP